MRDLGAPGLAYRLRTGLPGLVGDGGRVEETLGSGST
jgi:hypothetical protein